MPSRLITPEGEAASLVEFRHDEATLVAESFGAGERTYVLLHGIGMGRSVFVDLAGRLDGRVIGIDLPGFGEAPEPATVPTMTEHAGLVAAYLTTHRITGAVIIGHSMGCQIAMEMAVRFRELVGALVLAGPTVDPSARTVHQQAGRMLWDILHEKPIVIWRGAREYVRGGPRVFRKIRVMLDHRPEDLAPLVRVPVLVVRGENDQVAAEQWSRRLAASMPGATYAEVPGFRHETMIRDAAPMAALVNGFLAGR